jgi:hypothetical protein
MVAARDEDSDAVDTDFSEALSLAAHTGERNHLLFHFGSADTSVWELSRGSRRALARTPPSGGGASASIPPRSDHGSVSRRGTCTLTTRLALLTA